MYFESIYISETALLTHTCTYVYKTLNDERHKSCRVLFYLALLLLPREKIWALAIKCLMTTLHFSFLQMDTAKMYWHFPMAGGQDSNRQATLRVTVLNW